MNDAKEKFLSGCYHDGVVYATGYELEDGEIELDNKLFTTFDTGIDGGVMAEINRLDASFDPSNDIRRFVVSLKLGQVMNDEGCDECGTHDRAEGDTLCEDCLDDNVIFCEYCDEETDTGACECEFCDTCDGWVEPGEPCISCDEEDDDEYGCMGDDDDDDCCDDGVVSPPLNAFQRARYLKSKE